MLRRLLDQYVPRSLYDRPKMGFGVPIADWLRGELREWAQTLLDRNRLRDEGFLNADVIGRLWQQHQASSATDWSFQLWTVLMFQAWHQEWIRLPALELAEKPSNAA